MSGEKPFLIVTNGQQLQPDAEKKGTRIHENRKKEVKKNSSQVWFVIGLFSTFFYALVVNLFYAQWSLFTGRTKSTMMIVNETSSPQLAYQMCEKLFRRFWLINVLKNQIKEEPISERNNVWRSEKKQKYFW